jgi:hypothetical protein
MYSDLAFAKCVSGGIDLYVSRALTVCLAAILSAAYALEMAVFTPFYKGLELLRWPYHRVSKTQRYIQSDSGLKIKTE